MKRILIIALTTLIIAFSWWITLFNYITAPQLKKAKDSSRVINLGAIESIIESFYQDNQKYPKNLTTEIFIFPIPVDPDSGVIINGCTFWYVYEVSPSAEWIPRQNYRLSTCLESEYNIKEKAMKDWWIYNDKFEIFSEN